MNNNLETWLSQEIEKRGWSVREFGRRIEVSPSHAARIANGDILPSIKVCQRIARIFDVSLEHIFRLAGILPPIASSIAEEREIVRILRALPQEERQDILQYAKFRQSGSSKESVGDTDRAGAKPPPPTSLPRDEADPDIPIAIAASDQQPTSVRSVLESVAMRAIEEIGEEGEQALINALLEVIKYREELKAKQPQDNQGENKKQ